MKQSDILGTEKVSTLLWKFSLPAIVGMVVNALYNVVDSIFVGNGVGDIGLTAVTIAFPIMLVLMGFGMLVGIGATALVSIRLGEQNWDEAEKILGNAVSLILILALTLTVGFLVVLDPLLVLLGAGPDVLPYARQFSQIILLGSIFQFFGFGLNNVIRAEGNPKTAMSTMIIGAVLNTILNPLFIMGLHLGISGSALATVCSQTVSSLWVLRYFTGGHSALKLRLPNLRLSGRIIKGIFAIGMSPFLMQIAASVVTLLFNQSLLTYGGDIAVAAMGITNRITMLVLMPIFGINQGAQPIIGYNYGARQYARVKQALQQAITAATVLSTLGFVMVQIFDRQIIGLFNDNPELLTVGAWGLRLYLLMLPVIGFQIVSSNYFQAINKASRAIFLSMLRQVIVLIPLILFLPRWFGLTGVWLTAPISDAISTVMTGLFLWADVKKLKEVQSV